MVWGAGTHGRVTAEIQEEMDGSGLGESRGGGDKLISFGYNWKDEATESFDGLMGEAREKLWIRA